MRLNRRATLNPRAACATIVLQSLLCTLLLTLPRCAVVQAADVSAVKVPSQQTSQDASEDYRARLARNPSDYRALTSLGALLARQQRYPEAIEAYRKALVINPALHETQLNLGLAYFKTGDFRAAIRPLSDCLRLQPANPQARTLVGMAYYGLRKYREAAEELEKVSSRGHPNSNLLYVLAESYLWSGQYDQVLGVFRRIQQLEPDSAAAHMLAGEALDGLDRNTQAIQEFTAAAHKSPQLPNVHFALGYTYWKRKDLDRAASEFRKELQNDPTHSQAQAYLGDVYFRKRDFRAAEPLLRESSQRRREVRIAYLDLGAIYTARAQYAEAVSVLQQAIKIDPSKADAHFRLSVTYQAMGETDNAQAERRKMHDLETQNRQELVYKIFGQP